MKISDLIASFLAERGIRNVFGVTGGASLHMLSSFSKHKNIKVVYNHHEQASAFAADATWRFTQKIGVAVATSGPGAMNLIPGIASSFFDSVPSLFLTGQVATFRSSENMGIRQFGFQETDIVSMVMPIVKYANKVSNYIKILFELDKALNIALSGRMGPVLLDIPDDLQRLELSKQEINQCRKYLEQHRASVPINWGERIDHKICASFVEQLITAKKPVVVLGAGADTNVGKLSQIFGELDIPVIPTWSVADRLNFAEKHIIGTAGTHGNRYSNYILQNADLVIAIGCRLDSHLIGSPPSEFAPSAYKIVVDIDINELNKFELQGLKVDSLINCPAEIFAEFLSNIKFKLDKNIIRNNVREWFSLAQNIKVDLSDNRLRLQKGNETNPYYFIKQLSEYIPDGSKIICDTGCILAWSMQFMKFSGTTKFIHAFNNTPMGYAIPGAVAAGMASDKSDLICLVGDGSFMMNVQELATLKLTSSNARIFLINNKGYSMIKQTQEQWFDGDYFGSDSNDLLFPNYRCIAAAFDYEYVDMKSDADVQTTLEEIFKAQNHVICNVHVSPESRVIPQLKYGHNLIDMEPEVSGELKEKYGL